MPGEYLTNQFLVAMPAMSDPNFAQTVTLVCEHASTGRARHRDQPAARDDARRSVRAAGARRHEFARSRPTRCCGRPGADRPRLRAARARRPNLGLHARGLRAAAPHDLPRRRSTRWRAGEGRRGASSRSATPAGTPASSRTEVCPERLAERARPTQRLVFETPFDGTLAGRRPAAGHQPAAPEQRRGPRLSRRGLGRRGRDRPSTTASAASASPWARR